MDEEIQFLLANTKEQMKEGIAHLEKSLATIHAGKASPNMLAGVMVELESVDSADVFTVEDTGDKCSWCFGFEKTLYPDVDRC